ncbi:DNA polymerase III subunit beta [Erysipelatoclostridium sp. An173]|uniref:DNA polymerase III subunit beta n=1 Tax=unclassified Thomasclavelia TaxID=3025756 RepID=UPI000B377549|nr:MULTISPECIES: DNA polymerase III subunit beta [unclassified Thomasclavelia]OUP78552.1 DNA polymerase III subunit beta [Erysipelatoclostridium sp. An173]WRK53029.1 DNA polymerase III subunit beta [Coprobacillaceae bacterium CR2/5/TPMF4]
MKFRINRLKLLNALSKTTKAVSIRSPLPVLTGIKFDLQPDGLILTGSDSDITIQTKIETSDDLVIEQTGGVVLNSRYILEIVRKIDSDEISLEIIDGSLTRISGATSKFDLNGNDVIDYPRIDLSKTGTKVLINAFTLKDVITQTKFAASEKEHKPILTGINFKAANNQLEVTATDSYRLAKKVVPLDDELTFNITIPQKSLDEIAKIIERDDLIEMYVSDRKVLYVFDNNIIQTRLIDGTFPDTNRLIPESFDYELDIDTHYLLNAIDRVSLLNNEQNNIIKLDMSNEKVILSSYMQEIGSVEEILDRSFYKGDSLSISFSSKYATDALRAFNEPKVKILFTGAMKPFIVKDYEKDDLIQLVLPVRTY